MQHPPRVSRTLASSNVEEKAAFCSAACTYSSFLGLEYSVPLPDDVTPDDAVDEISLVLTPF